jgi:hypothetical protein
MLDSQQATYTIGQEVQGVTGIKKEKFGRELK